MRTPLRLFLCLFLTGIHLSLYSQAEESLPADRVSIKGTYTLKKIFDLIYRQTKQQVTYANTLLDDRERVTVDVSGTIDEALTVVLAGKAITWVYSDGYVALRERKASVVSVIDPPVVTVRGVVMDEEGNPLPGVTIKVKSSQKGTQSGHDGTFMLQEIDRNSVLIVSSIGFDKEEIVVKGKQQLRISLKTSVGTLGEVVVAYGTTTQRANTGAITAIKGEQIQNLPNRSFDKSLQGLVPGLQITNGTGQPGGGVSSMVLRGISTGTDAYSGSTVRNPLIIIDGIPVTQDYYQNKIGISSTPISNPLAQLNPSDIDNISVLKDAAAIALYGSKSSNGVILITTKKGSEGKTNFSFRSQADISFRPRNKIEVLDQQEYLNQLYEYYRNANSANWTDNAIRKDLFSKFPYQVNNTDTIFYPAPNWIHELYNNKASTFSNELSMSGGSSKNRFYFNLEYTKQDGIVQKTGYDRKSIRYNFENRPASWIKTGINSTFSYNTQNYSNPLEAVQGYGLANLISPLNPIKLNDGRYMLNYTWGVPIQTANPVATNEYNINRLVSYRGLIKLYGEATFLKFFSFASSLGVDFMLAESKQKQDPRLRNTDFSGNGSITDFSRRRANIISTNLLRFNKQLGHHNINVLVGQEAQIHTEKGTGIEVQGTVNTLYYYEEINNPGYSFKSFSNIKRRQTLLSQFSQLLYNYRNKYHLSGSFRRDGSSLFGDKQQWGTYWSVGTGWVVTEEPFMKPASNLINYLKIRGSIGVAGNSGPVGEAAQYNLLTVRNFQGNTALLPSEPPGNPFIQWEETLSWDAGIEVRILRNRLSLTADIYKKYTSELIYNIPLPSYAGARSVNANIGDMNNYGAELAIAAKLINAKSFQWQLNANWSTNRNVLVKANMPLSILFSGLLANEEGRNFNSFYLPIWAGVNPTDGKPQWLDSAGKPTSDYTSAQKFFVGKPQPDGFGSINQIFSYKGFEASVQFYYQYGAMIFDENSRFWQSDGAYPYLNQLKQSQNHWKKPGDMAINPRVMLNNADRGNASSTRQLFDGDYIRLQVVTLSYNFPRSIIQKLKLDMLKIYLQGNNMALWSKVPGMNPDNMNTGGGISNAIPVASTVSAGVNIQF